MVLLGRLFVKTFITTHFISTVIAIFTYTFEKSADQVFKNVTATYTRDTPVQCARLCAQTTGCDVYNFHPVDRVCQLCEFYPGNDVIVTNKTGWGMYMKTATSCMSGWTRFNDSCYWLDATQQTRQEALNVCTHHTSLAHLIDIQSTEELTFMQTMATGANIGVGVWVAVVLNNTTGTFVWSDGTTVPFEYWGSTEPNGDGQEPLVGALKNHDFLIADVPDDYMLTSFWVGVWVGAMHDNTTGTFVWNDGTTVPFEYWGSTEPNGDGQEPYVAAFKTYDFLIADVPDDYMLTSLCEYKLS